MLIYEHSRTKELVNRLVALGNTIRLITISCAILSFGALLSLLVRVISPELWWAGGLFGVLVGYGLGFYAASLVTVTLEWMAQLLVAQGEILAALKKK